MSFIERSTLYLKNVVRLALGRPSPFILCYHGVAAEPPSPDPRGLFVTRSDFEDHLDLIEGRGYDLVGVSDLWRRMSAGEDVSRLASITFDDGFKSASREAMPILAARGASSTMFVSTGLLDGPHPHMPTADIMSADEVLELRDMGMEIGAHTVDHPRLPEIRYDQVLEQLRTSRAALEDLLGEPVTSMAYPFGAFDQRAVTAAAEAGYEIACGCSGPAPWEPLSLPREPVFPSTTRLRLRLKMAGLFGPVHMSRDLRAALRSLGKRSAR